MRKLFFAVLFIAVIFFGYRYLVNSLTEPISETNMTPKEAEQYLAELNEISDEEVQHVNMLTLKQCFEMAEAYKIYSCMGTMIVAEEYVPNENLDLEDKGKYIYGVLGKNKPIIEMDFKRLFDTEEYAVFEVTFLLLEQSNKPMYHFYLSKDNEVIKIVEGEQ